MKKIITLILLGYLSSVFAAEWHYGPDGCTKVYAYGSDISECDTHREILQEAGLNAVCKILGYCK